MVSRIVGTPKRSLIFSLNQRKNTIGIGWGNRNVDFPERRMGQAMFLDASPFHPAVMRHINPAAWPSAEFSVGMHLYLPHAGKQRARVVRIHCQPGTADIFSGEKNSLPVLTSIGRPKDTTLLLRARSAP